MPQSPSLPQSALDGPSLAPPPGVVPNFEDPWNLNEISHMTNAICLLATIVAVLIRVYAKVVCSKRAHIEDCQCLSSPNEKENSN